MSNNSQSVLRGSIRKLLLAAPVWLAIPVAGHAQEFAGRYELVEDSGTPVPYGIDAAAVASLFSCSGQITEAQLKGAVQTLLPDGTWRTTTTFAGRCTGRDGRQKWMEASTEGGQGTYTTSRGEARLIASTGLASVMKEMNGVFTERFRDDEGQEQVQVWRRAQRLGGGPTPPLTPAAPAKKPTSDRTGAAAPELGQYGCIQSIPRYRNGSYEYEIETRGYIVLQAGGRYTDPYRVAGRYHYDASKESTHFTGGALDGATATPMKDNRLWVVIPTKSGEMRWTCGLASRLAPCTGRAAAWR